MNNNSSSWTDSVRPSPNCPWHRMMKKTCWSICTFLDLYYIYFLSDCASVAIGLQKATDYLCLSPVFFLHWHRHLRGGWCGPRLLGNGHQLACHCLFSNPHHGKEKICFVQENLTHGTLPTVSLLFQTCDEFQTYRTPDFPNNSPRAAFRHRLLKCYVQTNCGCYTQPFNACHKKNNYEHLWTVLFGSIFFSSMENIVFKF